MEIESLEERALLSAAVIDTLDFSPSRIGAIMAANAVTGRVYAAAEDVPAIRVIDSATDAVLAEIPTRGYHTGIAVNPVTNRVYVSQQFARSVRVIDGATNTFITDLPVPGVPGFNPTIGRLAVNPITHRLYVGENDNNIMEVFDIDTNTFLHQVTLPSGYAGPDINVDTALNRIYVTGRYTADVTILDGATESVIAQVPTEIAPVSVGVDSVRHRAYVVNNVPETVSVIDGDPGSPTANTVVATIAVGSSPGAVGVNPTTGRVYVANNASHTVSIIDGPLNTVIETVPMPAGASTLGPLAVVPGTSRIYVAGEPSSLFVIEDTECAPVPPGLIAWYSGESDATDRTGQHNGRLMNGLTFAPGRVGQAFHFDGVDDYIRVPHDPALNPADGFAIEAWINSTSTSGAHVIASKWNDNTSDWSYIFKDHNSSDKLRIELSKNIHNDLADLSGTSSIPLGTWVHVAATFDGSAVRVYFNGVEDARIDVGPQRIDSSTTDLLIGAVFTGGSVYEHFAGLIDELALYDRALSTAEIQAIVHAGSAGKCLNQPPTASAGGPYSVGEGGSVRLDASGTTDPDQPANTLTYEWDLDNDGVFGETGADTTRGDETGVAPTYSAVGLDGPSFGTVTVRVTDGNGLVSMDTTLIAITNVAPTPAILNVPASSPEGTLISLASAVTDASPDDEAAGFTYAWSVTKNGSPFDSGSEAAFDFTPDDDGAYVVSLAVTDKDGDTGTVSRTVTVTNVAHTPAVTSTPASSPEGSAIALGSSVSDPGADTFTYAWDVTKDGSAYVSGTGPGFTFTPDDNGTYVVTLTVTDDDGGSGSDSKSIAVTNVAPSVAITAAPSTSPEGTAISLGSTVSDPGSRDTHTFSWNVTKDGNPFAGGSGPSFSFTPDDNGTYVVTLTARDDDGGVGADSATIVVTNVHPNAAISGGPASSPEGTVISLTGSVSDPGAADTHALAWSVTKDGNAFASGSGSSFSFTPNDNGTYVVTLTVTDDDGGVGTDSKTIPVTNVAPVISSFSSSSPAFGGAIEGQRITVSGKFGDAGTLDTHTATINWGDGSTDSATVIDSSGSGTVSASHVYPDGGTYRILLTLTDDDGAVATRTAPAVITGAGVHNGVLEVIGTNKNDQLLVAQLGSQFRVSANFLPGIGVSVKTLSATGVRQIQVILGDGNDQAVLASTIQVPALVDGGAGNDLLQGGGGPNILLGGAGNDTLSGGAGRDLLIGGWGADFLAGNGGEDILIGGWTQHDGDYDALNQIMAEWSRLDQTYTQRTDHLQNGGGLNGPRKLNRTTVFDDFAADTLWGGAGDDWFFANLSGAVRDLVSDRNGREAIVDI